MLAGWAVAATGGGSIEPTSNPAGASQFTPDTLKLKEAELTSEQRRLANFVAFIGEGRGSQALAKALVEIERRVDRLADEVDSLCRSR